MTISRLPTDWAGQRGTDSDPLLYPLFMEGEDRSVEELAGRCERGLLVKRLWYICYVDRRELLLTGMTRDGLFLIEWGKIADPVENLYLNESPVVFLKNVSALSRPERVGPLKVPGILNGGFTLQIYQSSPPVAGSGAGSARSSAAVARASAACFPAGVVRISSSIPDEEAFSSRAIGQSPRKSLMHLSAL